MPALDATRMKNAMKSAIDGIDQSSGAVSNDAILDAMCVAIVNEIQNNFINTVFNVHQHPYTDDGVPSTTSAPTQQG